MAIYYLRGNIGSGGAIGDLLLQRLYKDPYSGFTYFFNAVGSNAKSTIAEAASVYNGSTGIGFRYNAGSQAYIGPNGDGILYPNPGYYGPEYMRDQGYPQVSRWYVPSIDELAFIAAQCQQNNFQSYFNQTFTVPPLVPGLPTTITNGQRIGNYSTTFVAGASGWVWSSTGTFNEGNTAEYIQATGGIPFVNCNPDGTQAIDPSSALYGQQVLRKQFTKAWAMKFAPSGSETNQNLYRLRKFSDNSDKAEVRLVRMIRCDNRYFKNEGTSTGQKNSTTQANVDEKLKNNCWAVPRLTASAIVNGSEQHSSSAYTNSNRDNTRNQDINFSILNSPP